MRKVLFIFGVLSDADVEWMCEVGEVQVLAIGERLITAGAKVHEISVLLRGELGVYANGSEIARLDEGEIVGELSFLDARPPYASVEATEKSEVLKITHSAVAARFARDAGFEARFYRSLGIFLASRLRQTVGQFGVLGDEDSLDEESTSIDELDPALLDRTALAGRRFERLRRRLGVE